MNCKGARELLQPQPGDVGCRKCMLPVLVAWYMEELQEQGSPLHEELKSFVDGGDFEPEQMATKLDDILNKSSGELHERLTEFNASFEANAGPERDEREGG